MQTLNLNPTSLAYNFLKANLVSLYSRKKILSLRRKRLNQTLINAYNTPSYRELWKKHGITRENLLKTPLYKFPIVDKKQLMESFTECVSENGITKKEIEEFIEKNPSPAELYKNKYISLNTSGSTGYTGIFIYTKKFWTKLVATLMARLIPLSLLLKRPRIAFIGETSGHHASITLVASAHRWLFKTLALSLGESKDKLIKSLNEFNPHILIGYPSALANLAELKKENKLTINPKVVISSGEPLTKLRKNRIIKSFKIIPLDLYSSTECPALGIDKDNSETLTIFDDLVFIESIDDKGNPIKSQNGRVVITILNNKIQPLVRYALDDQITLLSNSSNFTKAAHIQGRKLETLFFSYNKKKFEIYPLELVGFVAKGMKQYQAIQINRNSIKIKIVSENNKKELREKLKSFISEILKEKNLPEQAIRLKIEFVNKIPPNPKTGKTPIIIPYIKRS